MIDKSKELAEIYKIAASKDLIIDFADTPTIHKETTNERETT